MKLHRRSCDVVQMSRVHWDIQYTHVYMDEELVPTGVQSVSNVMSI